MTNKDEYSSSLLRSIFDVSSEGILVIDHETRQVLEFNKRFLQMWKFHEASIETSHDSALLGYVLKQISDPQSFLNVIEELYRFPEQKSLDILSLSDSRWFERKSEPLIVDGEIKGRIWFFRDITREKKDFEKISNQGSILEAIISSIPHFILWKNVNLEIMGCNEKFAEVTGYSSKELVGKKDKDYINHEDISETISKLDYQAMKSGQSQLNVEESYLVNDDIQYYVSSRVPLKYSSGEVFGLLVFVTDVTEIKKNEKSLKEKESQLVHASQLSSLGEMAAGIAHEINNPLAIIKASTKYLNKMIDKNNLDPLAFRETCAEINSTVERIASIITGLKNISRRADYNDQGVFCFDDVFHDVLSVACERLKHNEIELRRSFSEEEAKTKIRANRVQLSQVLVNLLNNSIDALEELRVDKKWIDLRIDCHGENITLKVSDAGPGIPVEVRREMFKPFYTTKEIGKGTGIGLSISKSIIENAGGRFYYDERSTNTSFIIEFKKAA